jgi:serine/threonine protein kinase
MNDVWSSSDGLHWIQESVSAQWKSRMFHCTVSLNGSMYVIGGSDGKTLLSDVWGSSDRGATWTLVCEAAPWGGRQGHSCVVVEGEVYLIGGLEAGGTRRNDVWKSSDCAEWAKVDCGPSVAWTARQGHSCGYADGAIYLAGGWSEEEGYHNDLYSLRLRPGTARIPSKDNIANTTTLSSGGEGGGMALVDGLPEVVRTVCKVRALRRSHQELLGLMADVRDCVQQAVDPDSSLSSSSSGGGSLYTPGDDDQHGGFALESQLQEIYTTIMKSFEVVPVAGTGTGGGERSVSKCSDRTMSYEDFVPQSPFDGNNPLLQTCDGAIGGAIGGSGGGSGREEPDDVFFAHFYVSSKFSADGIVSRLRRWLKLDTADSFSRSRSVEMYSQLASRSLSMQRLVAEAEEASDSGSSTNLVGKISKSSPPLKGVPATANMLAAESNSMDEEDDSGHPNRFTHAADLREEMAQDMYRIRRIQKAIRMRAEASLNVANNGSSSNSNSNSSSGNNSRRNGNDWVEDPDMSGVFESGDTAEINILTEKRSKLAQKAFQRAMLILRHTLLQKQVKLQRQRRLQQALARLAEFSVKGNELLRDSGLLPSMLGSSLSLGPDTSDLEDDEDGFADLAITTPIKRVSSEIMGVSGLNWSMEWQTLSKQVARLLPPPPPPPPPPHVSPSAQQEGRGNKDKINEGEDEDGDYDEEDEVDDKWRNSSPPASPVAISAGAVATGCDSPRGSSSPERQSNQDLSALATLLSQLGEQCAQVSTMLEMSPAAASGVSTASATSESREKEEEEEEEILSNFFSSFKEAASLLAQRQSSANASVQREFRSMGRGIDALKVQVRSLLATGRGYVEAAAETNQYDLTRFSDTEQEVVRWIRTCIILSHQASIEERCNAVIDATSNKEDDLVHTEMVPIDVRAKVSKAALEARTLRGGQGRRRFRANSGSLDSRDLPGPLSTSLSQSMSPNSSSATLSQTHTNSGEGLLSTLSLQSPSQDERDGYMEALQHELAEAERVAKSARRMMRTWNRNARKIALEYAPEMFLLLPDLLSPGSVLGDGGFGELAGIPRKRFQDYEIDYTKPVNAATTTEGRIKLYKATYDGEQVVLKMFLMNNPQQRLGLERELSTLGRLNNDTIIAPLAIVDGCTYEEEIEESLKKMAIYVEYPYYSGGNLDAWLGATDRKPWELQSVARQVLYGLSYLHDSGVIHKDIRPSNILFHDDGRLVIADFDLAVQMVRAGAKRRNDGVAEELRSFTRSYTDLTASPARMSKHQLSMETTIPEKSRTDSADSSNMASPEPAQRTSSQGYTAPELMETGLALYESDMYSYGVLLFAMHFGSDVSTLVPGNPQIPLDSAGSELDSLIRKLTKVEAAQRLSAAQALLHPYFRVAFAERLQQEGEVVEQDRKLDAVRNLLARARVDNMTNVDRITVSRSDCARDVLRYFRDMNLQHMRYSLRVDFEGEAGVDEGGPLTEMFEIFFETVLSPSFGLFHGCDSSPESGGKGAGGGLDTGASLRTTSVDMLDAQLIDSGVDVDAGAGLGSVSFDNDGEIKSLVGVVLPDPADLSMERLHNLRAFGRAMIKAMYEGRRIGTKLGSAAFKFLTDAQPSIRDLQQFDPQAARSCEWTLATEGVQDFGLHFDSVNAPELGDVTDKNKSDFVRRKIQLSLIECRKVHLAAIRNGFVEALKALSPEAAPFMGLLSHTDWRIMLCGDQTVSGPLVVSCLRFTDFGKKSMMPIWLKELILAASEDHLRKFLVFLTGSPSLSTTTSFGSKLEIHVRGQPRSEALPVAHTCFFQLDIPDYQDKETLQSKFVYAITHAQSFEMV